MVNIRTYKSLTEDEKFKVVPIEDAWELEDLTVLKQCDDILREIIDKVEGVAGGYGWISPKFIGSKQEASTLQPPALNWNVMSTGCKTAVLALLYTGLDEPRLLDISETGPIALQQTLEILDGANNVTGVIYAPIRLAGNNEAFELCINGSLHKNWISVIAQLAREM